MLKKHSSFILDIQKTIDIGITAFSFIAAYFIKRNMMPESLSNLSKDPNYYIILLLIIIAWYISFKWMHMYQPFRQQAFYLFFTAILKSCFMGMVLVSIAMYFLHIQGVSRLLMGIFLVLNISLLTLSKFIIFKILEKIRTDGLNTRNVIIVGSKYQARQVIEVVEENKATGYKILGCFDIDEKMLGQLVLNEHNVIGLIFI